MSLDYKKLVAVFAYDTLFEMKGNRKDGLIGTDLKTNDTKFIPNRGNEFYFLHAVEIFCEEDNKPLIEIFKGIQATENPPIPAKLDNDSTVSYFSEVIPYLDFDRVKVSEMKKILRWYLILKELNFDFSLVESN